MYPVLFRIGDFEVTTFGPMIFLSFISASWILSIQLRKRKLDPEFAWDVLAWAALAGMAGAKLYYLALHWQDLAANPMQELTNRGGFVWYGGLIGGVLAYWWQARRHRMPLASTFDAAGPALALAYAVGRMGCFLVGDDYGLPTDSWVGVKFPEGSPPSSAAYLRSVGADVPASIPNDAILAVHPTQLYEVGLALIMFAILWQLSNRALRAGQLFAAYLALYGVERFFIEFVRAKGDRIAFGMSTSQLMSALLLVIAAALWAYAERNQPKLAPSAAT